MPSEPGLVVEAFVKGVNEANAAVDAMQRRVDLATISAIKKAQTVAKRSVKSGMRGRPRWDRRGAIGRDGGIPAVNLDLDPHHSPRGGGPGKLTGMLSKSVGVVRRPKRTGPGTYEGGIGVGGTQRARAVLIYRKEVEDKYPYMAPGVEKVEPKIAEVYKAEWAKATET